MLLPAFVAPQPSPRSPSAAPTLHHYVRIPTKLVEACLLQSRTHYIGIYAFVGRQFLIRHGTISISANDLLELDPSLSYGQSVRALNWLSENGWLIPTVRPGQKTRYVPSWGFVNGTAIAWDASDSRYGRRPHMHAKVCLDVRIFDTYMGSLTLHDECKAHRRGYFTAPLLTFTDVGSYVQRLLGYSNATNALIEYGLVSITGTPREIPDDHTVIERGSQVSLLRPDAPHITEAGLTRLGIVRTNPPALSSNSSTLFFAPCDMIAGKITCVIEEVIEPTAPKKRGESASVRAKSAMPYSSVVIPEKNHADQEKNYPPHPERVEGGMPIPIIEKVAPPIPDTEQCRSLQQFAAEHNKPINPRVLIELSTQPIANITYGIHIATTARNVNDPVAFAIAAIRDRRDYSYTASPLPSPLVIEGQPGREITFPHAQYGDLFRLGSDTTSSHIPSAMPKALQPVVSDLVQIWSEALGQLRIHVHRRHIPDLVSSKLVELSQGQAQITVPTLAVKALFESQLTAAIRSVLKDIVGQETTVRIILRRS